MTTHIDKTEATYVGYVRKSTEDSGKQVQSIEDQTKAIEAKAKREGYKLVKIFKDEKSGGKPGIREGFNAMIDLIESGKANGIMAWKLDRLSRNPQDSGYIHQMINDKKIRWIVTESRDYCEDDDIMFDVEASMDAKFRKDLMKNVRRGMVSKAEKGWMPCVPPIGYVNDRYDKTIVKDPETWDKVRMVFDKFLTGTVTVAELTRYADEKLSLRTHQRRKSGGRPLTHGGIRALLKNEFYTGDFTYAGKKYNGNHPVLITREEFDRVQQLLEPSNRDTRPKGGEANKRIFSGLIRCANCGYAIVTEDKHKTYKNGKTQTFTYCHCSGKCKDFKCPQKKINLPEKELTEQVKSELSKYTIDPEFFELAKQALAEEEDARIKIQESKVKELRTQRDKVQNELNCLRRMRYKGEITDYAWFASESHNLENQITALETSMTTVEAAARDWRKVANDIFIFAKYAKDDFDSDDLNRKQYIMKTLGEKMELSGRTLVFTPSKYLIPIQKAVSKTKEVKETARTCDLQGSNDLKRTLISTWYTRRDSNARPLVPKTSALIR